MGNNIPDKIPLPSHYIIENSDSLFFNNQLLTRNVEYRINNKFKRIELFLKNIQESDSLTIYYKALPSWLSQRYGHALPKLLEKSNQKPLVVQLGSENQLRSESQIDLKGTKSFRFSTSKSGSSGFKQTLDLQLSGQLTDNLAIHGTISDRGYNPSYGTSNSRLNELDKINLSVESKTFLAQVGDIVVNDNSNARIREKKVSGLYTSYHTDRMQFGVTAARPKGQFESYTFYGSNNSQGPYQIKVQGRREAIIPGSEVVWLDGVEMVRGSNDDYIIDYPNGQITFNVNHLIDSRSRIVVDFEPLASEYKQEYLQAHSNLYLNDSTYEVQFNWIREGDDKNQSLSQVFSLEDELLLANSIGNESVYKSGIISDSIGDYNIIIDSLPDTVFVYVGDSLGEYDVRFSFVDSSKGDYKYQGAGRYEYVGVNQGDFLPIIILQTPKRTDYIETSFQVNQNAFGLLHTAFSQSRQQNNLYASNNTSINKNYMHLSYAKTIQDSLFGIVADYKLKEYGFAERGRVNNADYRYDFYFPSDSLFTADEHIASMGLSLKVRHNLNINPSVSMLRYQNQFNATNERVQATYAPARRIELQADIQSLQTTLDGNSQNYDGEGLSEAYRLHYLFYKDMQVSGQYIKIKRENAYSVVQTGFFHDEYLFTLANKSSEISYSVYSEDTLVDQWQKKLERKRIQFKSHNLYRSLDYSLLMHYQDVDYSTRSEKSFLSRTNLSYTNRKKKLQIQSSYMLSDETRFSKGIRYLEVNDGEGDYILSDSQYVPQAGGNYILVEELLSEYAPVKRGEKSFSINKRWDSFTLTLNSYINEELLASESRKFSWILPVFSDENLSYLFYSNSLRGSLKAFPINGGYFFTCNYSDQQEKRFINNQDRIKESRTSEFILNQKIQHYYLEEKLELFQEKRDVYYFRSGDIDGFATSGKIKLVIPNQEYGLQFTYRKAESANLEKSNLSILFLENRLHVVRLGELILSSEFYSSQTDNLLTSESYLLTDNHPGTKGVIWSLQFRTKVKKDFRLNLSVQGRHADTNKARIFARTEFVAEF